MINNFKALSTFTLIVLVWKNSGATYKIEYKKSVDIDYIELESEYESNTYAIPHLDPNTSYDVLVTSSDASTASSTIVTTTKIAACQVQEVIRKEWDYNDAEFNAKVAELEEYAFSQIQNKVTDVYRSVKNLICISGMINNYVMASLRKDIVYLNQAGESENEYAQFYTQLNNLNDDEEYQKKQTGSIWYRYPVSD